MAEEETKPEDQEESSSGSNMKMLIIIAVLCLVVGGGIGAGVFLMLSGGEEEVAEEAAEEVVEEVAEIPPQYVVLKPEFIVSFQVGPRQRYLQASIEVLTRHQSIVDALSLHEPLVRNNIIQAISVQDFASLRTPEGRLALQDTIKQTLIETMQNEAVEGEVQAVLFTNLVMQ